MQCPVVKPEWKEHEKEYICMPDCTSSPHGRKEHNDDVQPRVHAKSLQSCLTLCDPMDCSPPGSFVSVSQGHMKDTDVLSITDDNTGKPSRTVADAGRAWLAHFRCRFTPQSPGLPSGLVGCLSH